MCVLYRKLNASQNAASTKRSESPVCSSRDIASSPQVFHRITVIVLNGPLGHLVQFLYLYVREVRPQKMRCLSAQTHIASLWQNSVWNSGIISQSRTVLHCTTVLVKVLNVYLAFPFLKLTFCKIIYFSIWSLT